MQDGWNLLKVVPSPLRPRRRRRVPSVTKIHSHIRPIPLNRVEITHGAYRLLRILAFTGKHSLGLIGGEFKPSTGRLIIRWVEPIKNSEIVSDHPEWSDYYQKVRMLESEGYRILGEFHIPKLGTNKIERPLKNLKYNWISGRSLIHLIVTTRDIIVYTYDGSRFRQKTLQPR